MSNLLSHSESKLVFVDYHSATLIVNALSLFPLASQRPILVLITDEGIDSISTVDFLCTYERFTEKGDPDFKWVRPESEWDPMVLNYTSGTTSSPKGVNYHRSIYLVAIESVVEWSVPKNPVYLWTLPMFHTNGWGFPWAIAAVGGTNVCLGKVDGSTIYSYITRYKVTHMCGVPVVMNMLSNAKVVKSLKKPVHILTAGAPPPAAVISRTESLGFIVTHGYGLTDVWCMWKPEWDEFQRPERDNFKARQGVRALSSVAELDVIEANTGGSVKRDGLSLGEVAVRDGCAMLGYFKDLKETSKCMNENGWFYTGDVGVMHPDGYMEIKDRSKDIIISGGENVSSVEVESVLYTHPMVNEVAVVARLDEFWGETPCAFISLNTEQSEDRKVPSEEEIVEFCRARMPHYMAPKTVVFKDKLPKTSTGKIQKFVLREIAKNMGLASSRKSRL